MRRKEKEKRRLAVAPAVVAPVEHYSEQRINELVEADLISAREHKAIRRRWISRGAKPRACP